MKVREQNWNKNVIKEYQFINHLKTKNEINDNWISRYDSIQDLVIRIKHLAFASIT